LAYAVGSMGRFRGLLAKDEEKEVAGETPWRRTTVELSSRPTAVRAVTRATQQETKSAGIRYAICDYSACLVENLEPHQDSTTRNYLHAPW
jgi:hypothetical protein